MNEQTSPKANLNSDRQEKPDEQLCNLIKVECVWSGPTNLGECPIWDCKNSRLLWIDSLEQLIWSLHPETGKSQSWHVHETIGSIGLRQSGGLIAGFRDGFWFVNLENGAREFIINPEPDINGTRLNDGKCDRAGRFWCGTMNTKFTKANASLYRLDPDLTWHRMDEGFTVSNGIAWSLDAKTLYFSDSRIDRSYAYDFDIRTGEISNRRDFVQTHAYEGRIDGATVDVDGNYWAALFDGWALGCFSPQGLLIRKIELPVKCPTMCSFGGPNMDVLYVTSATYSLSSSELAAQPLAGGLFAVTGLGTNGMLEPEFGG